MLAEGTTTTYTVVLDTEPSGPVMVTIDPGSEVTTSTTTLNFTSLTWAAAQTVTLTAEEDADARDEESTTLTHTASGADYDSAAVANLVVTVTDDDRAGLTLTPMALMLAEGTTTTYTVVLDTEPSGPVMVTIDPGSEVTTSTTTLNFTSLTWAAAQTVTLTAEEDDDALDEAQTTLTHTASGADYDSAAVANLVVTVTDDDRVGLTLTPPTLMLAEGTTTTYTVVLDTEPSGPVMVTIDPGSEVTTSTTTLNFTSLTWAAAQTVTLTAEEDADARDEDPTTLTHTASGADYDSAAVANLVVTVRDDDRVGLTLTPPTLMLAEGTTTTYTVVLDTEPSGPVMVTIDPGSEVTTSTTTLNFTSLTWAAAQTVTLTAEEDADARDEDPTRLTHTASGADYDSAAVANLVVTVRDDDRVGLTLTPPTLMLAEGTTTTYTVVLDTEPSGPVMVTIDPGSEVTTSTTTLNFTSLTWAEAQTVTLTAEEDADARDEDPTTLTHTASGADYDSAAVANLVVTVTDDDRAGLTLTPPTLMLAEGTTTTYTVVLDTEPSGPVMVTIDPGSEVTTSTTTLNFTSLTWAAAQTVTLTAEEDADARDEDPTTLTHTASGANYDSAAVANLVVTVRDDDRAGLTLTPPTLMLAEGTTTTYTVVLDTEPSGPVMVTIDPGSEVTTSTTTLNFTSLTWAAAQTVTLTAEEDADARDEESDHADAHGVRGRL